MADKRITTHPKVRKLQRTLYQQAKSKPNWRAWSLYADLCRREFVEEAMSRVYQNQGGMGCDGYSVQQMMEEWETFRNHLEEELKAKTYRPSPVLRVEIPKDNGGVRQLGIPTVKDRVVQTLLVILLEPILEADFHDESYGYRPQRNAKQAVTSISKALYWGKTVAIEADLSRYFDTVCHVRLLRLVKKRVSDGSILKLIKAFLRVPTVERKGGKTTKTQVHPNTGEGVPQGGVISPLLANLYLDKLDKAVNGLDDHRVKMVRYADDFVILVRKGYEGILLARVKAWLSKAKLTLNEEKTKITDTEAKGKIEFLGYEISEKTSSRTGNRYIESRPSKKSERKYRDKIRQELNHWTTWRDTHQVIKKVNRISKGWGNYFEGCNGLKRLRFQNYWLEERVRKWLSKKHKLKGRSRYKVFNHQYIKDLKLYTLPTQPT